MFFNPPRRSNIEACACNRILADPGAPQMRTGEDDVWRKQPTIQKWTDQRLVIVTYIPLALVHSNTVVISFPVPDSDEMTCFVERFTTTERRPGSSKNPVSSTLNIAFGRSWRLCLERTVPRVSNQPSRIDEEIILIDDLAANNNYSLITNGVHETDRAFSKFSHLVSLSSGWRAMNEMNHSVSGEDCLNFFPSSVM